MKIHLYFFSRNQNRTHRLTLFYVKVVYGVYVRLYQVFDYKQQQQHWFKLEDK